MPESGTPRKTATARRKNQGRPADEDVAPKHSSYYEAATVHARIREWQTQDALQAIDPDVLSVRSQPRSELCRTPVQLHSSAAALAKDKGPHSTPRKHSTQWVQQDNNSWIKQRRSMKGDKRSNGELRLTRDEEPRDSPSQGKSPPVGYVRSESQRTRDATSSRAEREARRRRRREARARANGGHALVDDGIRVYMKSESHLASEQGGHDSLPARSVRDEPHEDDTEGSPQYKSQLSFKHDGPLPDEQDEQQVDATSPKQPSRYAQTLGRPPEHSDDLEPPKIRKRGILNKTKDILTGRNDAPQTPSNRLPSIEAWLDEQPQMPDPFTDGKEPTPPKSGTQKPPKHRSHRREVIAEPTIVEVDDPNKIWESLNPVQQREARRNSRMNQRNASTQRTETSPSSKRRLFSFEVCDQASKGEAPTTPPPNYTHDNNRPPADAEKRTRSTGRRPRHAVNVIAPTQDPIQRPPAHHLHRENSIQPDRDIAPSQKEELPQHCDESVNRQVTENQYDAAREENRPPSRGLKRKLTTHEDLLSVLSQPRTRKSTRSVRSARNLSAQSSDTVIREAISIMQKDESKYVRELKTMVDGVTPVLLQSLLSKANAAATAGLFSENKDNDSDASFTRPVINMGVALQRLKNLHARIPLNDSNIDNLLAWAITAHKAYSDYVKSWRLGFQGVIVNLAPLDPSQSTEGDMLARDVDGDVTDDHGQKVDVAYLQKRPLIRIKKLSKLLTTIQQAIPNHEKAKKVADLYADLTEIARQRHSEEQGRLEDDAAANIDTTRARDIRTMAPLELVEVDKTRKVRARDDFTMSLYHSTGQRLDCRVEIVLRDDPQSSDQGGDILICQIEEDAKWLLFQPIHLANVSVRRDQSEGDLVVMIKGVAGIGRSWLELLALKANDDAAVTEWLHMLGSNPLPPKLNHVPSWNLPQEPPLQLPPILSQSAVPPDTAVPLSANALANLPSDVDVPIGEPSVVSTKRRSKSKQTSTAAEQKQPERVTRLSMGGGLQQKHLPEHYQHAADLAGKKHLSPSKRSADQSHASSIHSSARSQPSSASSSVIAPASSTSADSTFRHRQEPLVPQLRYPPQRFSQSSSPLTTTDSGPTGSDFESRRVPHVREKTGLVIQNTQDVQNSSARDDPSLMSGALAGDLDLSDVSRSRHRYAVLETEIGVRPRKHTRSKSSSMPLTDTIKEQWVGLKKKQQSVPSTPERHRPSAELVTEDLPTPRPTSKCGTGPEQSLALDNSPPPPPTHKSTYTILSSPRTSVTSLPHMHTNEYHQTHPEVRSPLKHQYQPSSGSSDSGSDSDETDATSDMSDDDLNSELKDQATPLVQVLQGKRRSSHTPVRALSTVPSTGTKTLDPSDSASNGPYRQVPPPSSFPANKKKRTIAMVCSWSDRGVWEPIQEDECSIVISPGLVQAFPMSAAHSQPMSGADWEINQGDQSSVPREQSPLVEFELTPIVPLRKGTALDITIRSPPTPNSTVRTTNNVMFRSRTVQECEKLYQLINWARCNNPTYAQLARSRPEGAPVVFAVDVPQTRTKSWFSFGSREKNSYRAPSRPPTSIADTATSGSSATSAFSALKKFGQNSPFSLKRSSIIRRPGLANSGDSLYSSSNGTGPSSGSSTPAPPSQAGFIPGPDGPNVPPTSAEAANGGGMVNNMKIRLFVRQGQKWEALGQSLLTVLPAAVNTNKETSRPTTPGDGASTPPQRISRPPSSMPQQRGQHFRLPSSGSTPHRIHGDGREKRILITTAKQKDVVLLDEILGESCFEKVMQTGIAVNVWKEDEAVQKYGGVMTGRSKMYMIQFRTSTEAAWVFNMCGTYRYGSAALS